MHFSKRNVIKDGRLTKIDMGRSHRPFRCNIKNTLRFVYGDITIEEKEGAKKDSYVLVIDRNRSKTKSFPNISDIIHMLNSAKDSLHSTKRSCPSCRSSECKHSTKQKRKKKTH